MSNFIEVFKQGELGKNFGLTTGIKKLDIAINGIQKKTSIGIAAAPKVGKTTFADYCFLISPYLQAIQLGIIDKVNWIYFSFEIDRISKEFKIASYFMAHDFGQYHVTHKGKKYGISQQYLMGKQIHINEDESIEMVRVTPEHKAMLQEIYNSRIIPMFGEYDMHGKMIKKGKIDFQQEPENPTGMNKYLWTYAKQHGEFLEEQYSVVGQDGQIEKKKRVVGYRPNDPDLITIILTDHVRKLRRERGFTMKENIDKWLEYSTWFRNTCSFTPINICHSNRSVGNVERLKLAGEFIYPTADDVKDTGNLAEESTILLTLFNPNDEKYNLDRHFGVDLEAYPNYRSIHITESRDTECPAHIQVNMFGGVNMFAPLNLGE